MAIGSASDWALQPCYAPSGGVLVLERFTEQQLCVTAAPLCYDTDSAAHWEEVWGADLLLPLEQTAQKHAARARRGWMQDNGYKRGTHGTSCSCMLLVLSLHRRCSTWPTTAKGTAALWNLSDCHQTPVCVSCWNGTTVTHRTVGGFWFHPLDSANLAPFQWWHFPGMDWYYVMTSFYFEAVLAHPCWQCRELCWGGMQAPSASHACPLSCLLLRMLLPLQADKPHSQLMSKYKAVGGRALINLQRETK